MTDARKFLVGDDAQRLKARVRDVEQSTGAEFVVVVATESGRYDRAESIVGAIAALVTLAAVDELVAFDDAGAPLWAQALAVAIGLVGGTALASLAPIVRRPFVGRAEIDAEVERAALAHYAARRVGETTHGAGSLVYLSLFERRLHVVVDDQVQRVAGDDFARRVADVAAAALRRGERARAVDAALDEAERALAGKLPARSGSGELDDALLIVHPR